MSLNSGCCMFSPGQAVSSGSRYSFFPSRHNNAANGAGGSDHPQCMLKACSLTALGMMSNAVQMDSALAGEAVKF